MAEKNDEELEEWQQEEEKKAETPPVQEKKEEDYKERMLRLAAEFDNYKKRVKSDVENAKGAGKAELVKGILPILDEFELAIAAANNSEDKTVVKGMEMVYGNLMERLKKEGLKELHTNGKFDPYKHEIIITKESKKAPGTILEVVKKGYTFNEMLIRPASVIVAKEHEEKEEIDTN